MVITFLCEPRSGSTNFTNWFYGKKNISVLYLPSDNKSKWYLKETPKNYKYNTEFLIVKEDYYPEKNFDELIEISTKTVLLYRENISEQIESWINSKKTNNWDGKWVFKSYDDINEEKYFKYLKSEFYKNFLSKDYFKISYEELYYKNGFDSVLKYLKIPSLENAGWPYGEKYRLDIKDEKKLI